MSILFMHSRSKNIPAIRKQLKEENLHRRVLVLTLASFPLVHKEPEGKRKLSESSKELSSTALDFSPSSLLNYNLFYRIEKKVPRTVDFIDKQIRSDKFLLFKEHLMVYDISVNEFESAEEYERVLGHRHSPFVICNYRVFIKLKHMIDDFRGKVKFICFDVKEKNFMIKQEGVFHPEIAESVYATDKILDVSDFIVKNPIEQLILQETTYEEEIKAYHDITRKYHNITRKGAVIEFHTEMTEKNYTSLQQVAFLVEPLHSSRYPEMISDFLSCYVKLWKLEYIPTDDIKYLKEDLCKSLRSLFRNEAIVTSNKVFYIEYISKVMACNNLSELSELSLYLCSLPHGLSTSLNYLLSNFWNNLRAISKFKPLLFLIMVNFCIFFQPNYEMEKKTLQIYFNSLKEKNQSLEVELKQGQRLYNTNFLECWENIHELKDYLEIEYEYYPLAELSPYYNLTNTEVFSFYKSGAEYTFSPFSTFEVREVASVKGTKAIKLKHISNYTFITLFMQACFNCQNPMDDVFLPAIDSDSRAVSSVSKSRKKKESAVYYQFMCALFKNRILEAENMFIIDKKREYKNVHGETFKLLEEIWLLVKKGEYQEAMVKAKNIKNTLQFRLESIVKSFCDLVERIVKARRMVLDNTDFYIFKRNQKSETPVYKWDSKYEVTCDQFALSENVLGEESQLSFIRVPEVFKVLHSTCLSEDKALAKVL